MRRRAAIEPPNWWGWGWGPGHQESAEFAILETYFTAAYGLRQRLREIMHPNHILNFEGGWLLTFLDRSTLVVPR